MPTIPSYTMEDQAGAPRGITIITTLYELIAALSADLEPGEETLITATVTHLFNSGRLTFVGQHRQCKVVCG